MIFKTFNHYEMEEALANKNPGKNANIIRNTHGMWIRFGVYDKKPPFVLIDDGKLVCVVFATMSKQNAYVNLYEIATFDGEERKGYARTIWKNVIKTFCDHKMTRLKLSCTPNSIEWHIKNGLVFWAVDPTGSLRSDQPIFPTIEEQINFREKAILDPKIALPTSQKVISQLQKENLESYKFGKLKAQKTQEAIAKVGKYWLREELFKLPTLVDFYD